MSFEKIFKKLTVTNVKLLEKKTVAEDFFQYYFLIRVEKHMFSSSYFTCILGSEEDNLTPQQIHEALENIDRKVFWSFLEIKDALSLPEGYETSLGILHATLFTGTDLGVYGPHHEWARLPYKTK